MDLSYLDGKRIAIVLQRVGGPRVLRGRARYDENAGRLRVHVRDEPGSPEFVMDLLAEGVDALPDAEYGCDYVLRFEPS